MSAVLPVDSANMPTSPNWLQRLSAMDRAQRMRLVVGAALLVGVLIAAVLYGRQADYRVLFANLSDKDGGAIVAQLAQMNVPYKYSEGGGAITIPSDRVHDVRLRLATLGLPKGSVTGFELMENSRFGMTQFQERLNFQRGLEGELTRSIQALSSVQSARVHLALPNQNGFFREQQKPSASVLISLYPGRVLDRTQLAGIVHLVASSVPELAPSAVSVLDDTGKLLSSNPDGVQNSTFDAQQLQYVQQIEQQYTRRLVEMLEPIMGRNNVKAQVTADVDFSQTESTSEQFRPNQTADSSAIRSQQVTEVGNNSTSNTTAAVGAVANQPPAPSTAPINGANPAPTVGGQQTNETGTRKRESTTNYEVDKTVRVTRAGRGTIKRLSAAVVVNYQSSQERGKTVTKALAPEQIERMTALVRESIGFSQERGDTVSLVNAQFQVESETVDEVPLWKQPETLDLARSFAWPVGLFLFGSLVLLGLVRPALKTLSGNGPAGRAVAGGQLDALEAEVPQRAALPSPAVRSTQPAVVTEEQLRLEDARVLTRENPVAVANILKGWVNGDAS